MFFKSFRARLTWFFVVIVILPIVMVTAVLFWLVADSEQGKSDARLAQALTSANNLYGATKERSEEAGRRLGASKALAGAIASGDREAITRKLADGLGKVGAVRARLELPDGDAYAVGTRSAVAGAATTLRSARGRAGTLRVSVASAASFAKAISDLTGLEAVLSVPGRPEATTLEEARAADLPLRGKRVLDGRRYRLTSFTVPSFDETRRLTIRLLADQRDTEEATSDARLVVIVLLTAFVLVAFLIAAAVSRSLQAQIARLLQAAQRLGRGELDAEVPTEGNDEFAALGAEFNVMARQLQGRLDELEAERERLQSAIRRVGESIATGADRHAVLAIVVQTAAEGIGAEAGRASVREGPGGPLQRRISFGDGDGLAAVLDAAEEDVLEHRRSAELTLGDAHALSHPLRSSDGGAKVLGLVSVARRGTPFTVADCDLFEYLASQASVSIENVDLHESVQRQAITDGLTGLFNHRRFQEVMGVEIERSRRFHHCLGLVMLDIDDFKDINERWGHLQGDQVLREVARVLLDTAREIDEPARYGGEEMAVVLPQTDLDGAFEFAERLRQRIEALEVPLLEGDGVVRVTASVGAAALSGSDAADKDALVRAADSALYRAKRLGKNRVMKAG